MFGGHVQVSGSEVQPVVTVSRNRTRDQVPTGKFEGTAEGVDVEDGVEGASVAVGESESESGLLLLPAGVEPPVEAADELLYTLLAQCVLVDDETY